MQENIGVALANEVTTLTDTDIVVVEASSFQLESTDTFHPAVSVVLNFSRDHLDRHGTIDTYLSAKRKIYANQTSSDWIVLNAADTTVKSLANTSDVKKAYFSDSLSDIDLESEMLRHKLGTRLRSKANNIGIYAYKDDQEHLICDVVDMPLAGAHNVRNVLAAVVLVQSLM